MKTATEYREAVLRGWRLLVLLAVLGALVGIVRPVHTAKAVKPAWLSSIEVAPDTSQTNGAVSLTTIADDATVHSIIAQAAQAANLKGSTADLHVGVAKAKAGGKGSALGLQALELSFVQPTRARGIALAKAYGTAFEQYLTNQAQTNFNTQVQMNNTTVNCLEDELNSIDSDISSEQDSPGSVDPTSLFGDSGAGGYCGGTSADGSGSDGSSDSSSSDSTGSTSDTSFEQSSAAVSTGRSQIFLTDSATPTTTVPPTIPTTVPATTPTTAPVTTPTTAPSDAATTAPPDATPNSTDPVLAALAVAKLILDSRLHTALTTQADLATNGPATPMVSVQPAVAEPLVSKTKSISSITNNRGANVFGGAIFGMLLAAGILVAVETLDRSLRSSRQAEEAFELPVVSEIPMPSGMARPRPGEPLPAPRLEVVLAPTSTVADAYRQLRTAVLIEPLMAERAALESGYVLSSYSYSPSTNGHGPSTNGHGPSTNGHASSNGHGPSTNGHASSNGHGPSTNGHGPWAGRKEGRSRRVVLVVSAGPEVSRHSVIANLAATYAQTGERALVLSLGNLGWEPSGAEVPLAPRAADSDFGPADIVPLSSPTVLPGVRRLAFDQVLASRGQVSSYGPAVVAAARDVADVVIVDGLGLLDSRDALVLLPEVDVVIAVAEFGTTSAAQAHEVSDILRRFSAPVLGVVFTNAPSNGKVHPVKAPVITDAASVLFGEKSALPMPISQ